MNSSASNNPLPYVEISKPPMKLLIDTGCYVSIIRPSIAENHFPNYIYHEPAELKTAIGKKLIRFRADIPAFRELQTKLKINFLLFDFHDYFDGILGFGDLLKMKLSIDPINQVLYNDKIKIPFKYRQPDDTKFTFSVNANECVHLKLPVDAYEGDIILRETKISDLYLPETLSTAKNGFAVFEIHNPTDTRITTTIDRRIPVVPFPDSSKEKFHIFNMDEIIGTPSKEIIQPINELIRTEHLNSEEYERIIKLCKEYQDIFHQEGRKLTFTSEVKHEIKTKDEVPIHSKSYRYPFIHKSEVDRQIKKMLEDGIIRPSQSPWCSPIWIVPKKLDATGQQKWRIVTDYRRLNEKTIDDRYPLPNINDILDKLGRCQYFSTLDLASGFHQIQMDEGSIEKTAFNVENGHYEYVRMPFGLKNAPATFQRVMDRVLGELQNKVCLVYMDDIIIFSTSLEEHIANLRLVFDQLRRSRLKIQIDKSEFLRKEVEFLGHVITPQGIKPNPRKIEAIQKFPIPRTAKEIKSFLGLIGYYRRFIKDFSKITKPFTKCLKKGEKIEHTDEFIETFKICKNILCNDPLLQYPDFEKPFILTTDASNFAIGAVLSQGIIGKDLPVAYASRTLNPAEINYSTIEKELLAIVYAVKYFRPYLFGRKFTIVTDHKPLQWLFNLKEPNSRLVRWRLKLEEYDYNIVYKKGKRNTNADALSRIEINAVDKEDAKSTAPDPGDIDETIEKFLEDPELINAPDSPTLKNLVSGPSQKINIISDIQIHPPNNTGEETVHSSHENPILQIPISDQPLNYFKNQIIISSSPDILQSKIKKHKIFDKDQFTITLPEQNIDRQIIDIVKEYLAPKRKYAILFRPLTLAPIFITTVQKYFKNSSLDLVQTNNLVENVINNDDRIQKLKYHHEGKTCHKGITEMKTSLKKHYYWPDIDKDITNYVNTCDICQRAKYERHPPRLKFNLTPTSNKPFEHIHMDTFHVAKQSFITILDSFSRYGQAYSVQTSQAIMTIDSLLNFISHHGIPKKITTDRGNEFNNTTLKDFCDLHKIELHVTTAKNSNSNSPVERFHSTLIEELRCLKLEKPNENIKTLMNHAILGYNNAVHSVTGYTPFQIIKGHIDDLDPFDMTDIKIVSDYVQNHKEKTKLLYDLIKNKNSKIKEQVISKRNETREDPVPYEPNKIVYSKTKNRNKLDSKFRKLDLIKDDKDKIVTKQGTYHKSITKKPRKVHEKSLLQDDDSSTDNSTNIDSDIDSSKN